MRIDLNADLGEGVTDDAGALVEAARSVRSALEDAGYDVRPW